MHNVHSEFRSDFTLYVRTVPDLGCVNKTMHVDNVGVAPEYYDNHLLIVDEANYRIQMFTMEGKFVQPVGQKGQAPFLD